MNKQCGTYIYNSNSNLAGNFSINANSNCPLIINDLFSLTNGTGQFELTVDSPFGNASFTVNPMTASISPETSLVSINTLNTYDPSIIYEITINNGTYIEFVNNMDATMFVTLYPSGENPFTFYSFTPNGNGSVTDNKLTIDPSSSCQVSSYINFTGKMLFIEIPHYTSTATLSPSNPTITNSDLIAMYISFDSSKNIYTITACTPTTKECYNN